MANQRIIFDYCFTNIYSKVGEFIVGGGGGAVGRAESSTQLMSSLPDMVYTLRNKTLVLPLLIVQYRGSYTLHVYLYFSQRLFNIIDHIRIADNDRAQSC